MIEYCPLISRFGHLDGPALLAPMLRDVFPGRLAVVSSFGAESAVLLHMAAGIDRRVPVIFLQTGKLFPETLAYRDRLIEQLGLDNVRSVTPDFAALARDDPDGTLHASNPDGCCHVRKVAPLDRALAGLQAWVTGRKRFHGGARGHLATLEAAGSRLKVNPLARWSRDDLARYMEAHSLPPHPLEAQGFTSIGCAPCTKPTGPGAALRDGRWAGSPKTECGIHWTHNGRPLRAAAEGRGR
jgi:phosphoadenosine phosphosulfate reductase